MKVKLLVSRSGPAGSNIRGEEITVEDGEGVRMVEAGQAEALDADEFEAAKRAYYEEMAANAKALEPETAVSANEPEKAVAPEAEQAVVKGKPEKATK